MIRESSNFTNFANYAVGQYDAKHFKTLQRIWKRNEFLPKIRLVLQSVVVFYIIKIRVIRVIR
jgi:hypothetical protein